MLDKILRFISSQKSYCQVKEQNSKLMLIFEKVENIHTAYTIIQNIYEFLESRDLQRNS